jgi:hypothetical protein
MDDKYLKYFSKMNVDYKLFLFILNLKALNVELIDFSFHVAKRLECFHSLYFKRTNLWKYECRHG